MSSWARRAAEAGAQDLITRVCLLSKARSAESRKTYERGDKRTEIIRMACSTLRMAHSRHIQPVEITGVCERLRGRNSGRAPPIVRRTGRDTRPCYGVRWLDSAVATDETRWPTLVARPQPT